MSGTGQIARRCCFTRSSLLTGITRVRRDGDDQSPDADGQTATVELDEEAMPPPRLELDEGVYELEPIAGRTAPWLYRWRPNPEPV